MAGTGLQPAIIAVNSVCPIISGFVVAARVWMKKRHGTLAGEDWIIVVAWLLSVPTSVLTTMFTISMYQGYHDQDVPFPKIDFVYAQKVLYAMTLVYNPVMVMIKASFLWSLQKLRSPRVWVRRSLWAIQAINAAYGIAHIFVSAVPCIPVKKKWYPETPGSCYDGVNFIIGTITIVLITDALVLIMPTWIIYDLQMARSRKVLAVSFLSLGCVVIAVGVLRLAWLIRAVRKEQSSYSMYPVLSSVEVAVALIAASGPTMKWLLGGCIPALRSEGTTGKTTSFKPSAGSSAAVRSGRSKQSAGYYDLETDKGDAATSTDGFALHEWVQWSGTKHEGSAGSDEQKVADRDDGIMKTFSVSQTAVPVRQAGVL